MRKKRKITIITGFLGSGKTTLLSSMLKDPLLKNTAVIVNEFGKVGLDHHLLHEVEETTILLGGGCLCCSVREDLKTTLIELLDADQRGISCPLERVIIETSGLADPAPILFTVYTDPVLQHHFTIDHILVTVDAIHGSKDLIYRPEVAKQIAVADKLIITKTDMVSETNVEQLMEHLQNLNPSADTVKSVYGDINCKLLFTTNIGVEKDFTPFGASTGTHAKGTQSISVTFDKPVDWNGFALWLSMLLHARGEDLLRVKGMIDVGEDGPVFLNGVQHVIHPPQHFQQWPSDDQRSHVVFIAQAIDPEQILASLLAFQPILHARASLREMMHVQI